MKKRCVLFTIIFLLLALSACEQTWEQTLPTEGTAQTQSTISTQTTQASFVTEMSPLAQSRYLVFENASYPREHPVEKVMIHFTSAVMLDAQNPYDYDLVRSIFEDNKLGIHYLLDRDGTIYCFLPESRSAWHAGKGSFQKEKYTNNMNRYSIGIELMGIGSENDMSIYLTSKQYQALDSSLIGFTDAQYASLKALLADICNRHQIPMNRENIIGHQEYNPGKNDPGELFQWDRIFS